MTLINNYILSLFAFFVLSATIYSQNKKIDSLTVKLENHQVNDTTRVNLLYDLAYANFQRDMSLTNLYLTEAENLCNKLEYKKGKAAVFYLKGILENRKSNYDIGRIYFQQSLELFKAIKDEKGVASVYNALGVTYFKQSDYNKALEYFNQSLEIFENIGLEEKLISGLLNVGNIHAEIGSYEQAILNYKKVLKLSEETNHEYGIPYALNNLGNIYKDKGNYPLALNYFKKGLYYKEKLKDTTGIAITLNNLATIYTSLEDYDKALMYLDQSIKLSYQTESKNLLARSKGNIGLIYKNQKKYKEALKYINESLEISEEVNDLKQVSVCLNNIGEINLLLKKPVIARKNFIKTQNISLQIEDQYGFVLSQLGIAETYLNEGQYEQALSYARKAHQLAEELELLESQKKASETLSEIYKNLGDYKKSFVYHQQYKVLSDSIFNKENVEKITQLEYEYKYKQALDSASIRELKLTKTVLDTSQNLKKSQRNLLLGVIGFLVTTLILGGTIFLLKLRNEKTKTQNVIIEQKLLRSQMTPHFIFNSLSVLQGMILNKEEKKSVSYLSKFSKLLRTILENSRDRTVLLCQELMAIENYLALQNLENELYTYTIFVEDTIDTSRFKIPPMLIQPFVENALEHAFVNLTGNRIISIELSYANKELICIITDNGLGVDYILEGKNQEKKSLSTTITSERLQILSKDLKMKGSVTIEDRKKYNEQGTIVTLIIPYITISSSENINN